MTEIRIDALRGHSRDLAQRAIAWLDGYWDDAASFIRKPLDPEEVRPLHLIRSSGWYALGLLLRDGHGDRGRALRAIDAVLEHQYDVPGSAHHGTFRRSPDDPPVPAAPKVWRDYDPNWREFIGTTLALILIEYEARLPAELIERIDRALRRAVAGALTRGVHAGYTNIALMSAWLRVYAGERFGELAWAMDGERLAGEVAGRFRASGAFDEYNSPTYYGVDLFALALWRGYGGGSLRDAGAEMEAALWRNIARHYHAGMRNLAGPYDRSYGMDMRHYLASVGLAFWLAVGYEQAPLPELEKPFAHAWDLGFAPLLALVGTRVPEDALPHLLAFREEREIEQLIVAHPRRVATAWVAERVMLGGEDSGGRLRAKGQLHVATIHWLMPAGDVGWIRLCHEVPVDARAERGRLTIAASEPAKLVFEVCAPAQGSLTGDRWELPGLVVAVKSDATSFSATDGSPTYMASRIALELDT